MTARQIRVATLAAVLFALIGLTSFAAWKLSSAPSAPTASENVGLPFPKQPSIAVMPFMNISGDPEQEYFADGMTETIITDLAQLSDLLVIASNSVFSYKGKPVDVRRVSRELGVRHVLEGSVQKTGDRVRITAQLIEAASGNHVWAGRWDRPMQDLFAVQNEITRNIVDELNVKLVMGEQLRVWRRTAHNPEAYDYVLRCIEAFLKYTQADNTRSRELCSKALELDPEYAMAMVWIGWSHSMEGDFGWSKSQSESYEQAIAWARRAIAQDPSLGDAYTLLGDNLKDSGKDIDGGMAEMEKAVTLNPNSAASLLTLGWHETFVGRAKEGLENIKKAIRLNPFPPAWYSAALGDGYAWTGRYEEAIPVYKEALRRVPYMIWSEIGLTIALSQLGRLDEARAQAEELRRAYPNFSLDRLPYTMKPEPLEVLKTHLRRAGLN